jgi:Zn-dependent protease with chaperone function
LSACFASGLGEPVMESLYSRNSRAPTERISVRPWASEMTLKVFVILVSISVWVGLTISIIGIIYVAFIGLFFFCTHLLFIAMVRGSAVRVSPEQFPELYARVDLLCQRAGLDYVPETYVMQANGSLNALATKFLRSRMIVIFSDLLDACENDERAQDMIIGHEIGHIQQGHLDAFWFLLPGLWLPFLGSAYLRACEYTCDRYGFLLAGNPASALKGLAILAAGKKYGPNINYQAMVKQRVQLDTGFMTLGTWFMAHPPICDRLAALDPSLAAQAPKSNRGSIRAIIGLIVFFVFVICGTATGIYLFVKGINKAKTSLENVKGVSSNHIDPDSIFAPELSGFTTDSTAKEQ